MVLSPRCLEKPRLVCVALRLAVTLRAPACLDKGDQKASGKSGRTARAHVFPQSVFLIKCGMALGG